jgi:mono/diheme cytochrome c family protein
MGRFIVIVLLAAAVSASAYAQEGEPKAGLAYARSICTECHEIGQGAISPNPKAPPFGKIASTPGMTGAALHKILQSAHREMPDLIVPQKEKAGLIAYILSLKQ